MTTLYGIKNCDTIKKARKWLETNDIAYQFHDVRADAVTAADIERWINACGWETVLNKRGTTWRKLPETVQQATDESTVVALLLEHPAMIKRPVLDTGTARKVGFKDTEYAALLG